MAWFVLAQLGWLAVNLIATYYLRPDEEKKRAAKLDDFDFPRAELGDAVALAYGTVRIDSPQVIYFDPSGTVEGGDGAPVYPLLMRLLLARSNARVDHASAPPAQLVGFYIGDKKADLDGPGIIGTEGGAPDGPGQATYKIDEPAGSEYDGRTLGYLTFYDGRWDLERRPGDLAYTGDTSANTAYRGFITLFLGTWKVGSTQLAPYSPVIYNPCIIPGYEAQTSAIAGSVHSADCNPAAVLYDLLTNPWGGVGNESTLVDVASFVAAAVTLADEQHGISLLVTKPNEAREVIDTILRQIDGVLYQDMATGQYVLKLIREDYDAGSLPTFDTSNVVGDPEEPTTLWTETFNEVRVTFTEPLSGQKPATATAQDTASMAADGRVKSTDIRFPGCRSWRLANKLAGRELNFLSRPISTLRIRVNRHGFDLNPGDPFRFTWAPWGLTMVFRAMDIDTGTLDDGTIEIYAVQDRFAIAGTVFDPPVIDTLTDPPPTPTPIVHRLVTEAPRWIQKQAFDRGLINSPEVQRGYYLAAPEGTDSRYRVDSAVDGATAVADLPARAFPTTFTLSLAYNRTTDAYDTTVGIVVEAVTGGTLTDATAAQIRAGRNLLIIDGEILAYESVIDLGGGSYQLENVWRGLLDTVPADHEAGAIGYVLPGAAGVSGLGKPALPYGVEVVSQTFAAAGSAWTGTDSSPTDTLTTRSRTLLPARGANLTLNGTVTPAALEEEGVAISWVDRDAKKLTIARGDEAADALESGQTYTAVAYKDGLPGEVAQVEIFEGLADTSYLVPLGKIGHGSLEVGVDARRVIELPDGTTPTLGGWQVPTLPITAHHWRNLLRNPRFDLDSDYWTISSGTPEIDNTNGLGVVGYYLRGLAGSGAIVAYQDVDVNGYLPSGLSAVLTFYGSILSPDTDDTITVELIEISSGGGTLSTTTYGPSTPARWTKQALSVAAMNASTATLRVKITLTPVGLAGDTTADVGVTEVCLRVGQVSSQLVTNPSFESGGGSTTGWTATAGTWQVLTATPCEQATYIRPNDGASAQLRQTVALPTGYTDSVAILECARMNDGADDTGSVTLDAIDGGGSVLSTTTTGSEAISPSNAWVRRRLVLDPVPAGTANLRITLDATRVTGTPLNACFDDFDLRCHKHLDADDELSLTWSPVAQPMPRSAIAWKYDFPTTPQPDVAMYDGSPIGKLGIEPLLESTGPTAVMGAKAIVFDGANLSTSCFEGLDESAGELIQTAPAGTAFCNFPTSQSFTVMAFFKVRPGAALSDGFGICGRVDNGDGFGWQLRITDGDGFAWAKLVSDGGDTIHAIGTVGVGDGSLHGVAMIYDAGAQTLTLVDAAGSVTSSTATMGEISSTTPGRFRILWAGMAPGGEPVTLKGQVLRVYIWKSALTPTEVTDVLRYKASDPTGLVTQDSRTGSIACVTGEDADGVVVETFGPGRTAIGYDAASDRHGLVTMPDAENRLVTQLVAVTNTGTVTNDAATDPSGFRRAHLVSGDDTDGRTYEFDAGLAGPLYVTWFARAATAHNMKVWLLAEDNTEIDSSAFSLTTAWQALSWSTTWDDSVSTVARLRFSASDDGTTREVYLSPLISATTVPTFPGTVPVDLPGPTAPRIDASVLTTQVNREGELAVEVVKASQQDATIAELSNGTNDNDRRTLRFAYGSPTSTISSDHCNATGSADTSAQKASAIVVSDPFTSILRWNQAATFDGSAVFSQLRIEQGATVETDTGRGATFTASTTAVDQLDLGHEDGANVMAGLVLSARVTTRERKH